MAVGALVLAESQVTDGKLKRSEIISYASGYVDKYEVITREATASSVKLEMDVWVAESSIANRLLNRSAQAGTIDGAKTSVRIETVLQERQQGDRVLAAVLQDFPGRSFDLKLLATEVSLTALRETRVEIPFEFKWNYDYLGSLYEALRKVSQERSSDDCTFVERLQSGRDCARKAKRQYSFDLTVKPPGNLLLGWSGSLLFDDAFKLNDLYRAMVQSRPSVQLVVRDTRGNMVYQTCWNDPVLDNDLGNVYNIPNDRIIVFNLYRDKAAINGNTRWAGSITLDMKRYSGKLSEMEKIELKVVRGRECVER